MAELRRIHDPASDDPTIKGKRERVLKAEELAAIVPLLQYPAPEKIRRRNMLPKNDFGPAAMRFLLLTLARREEVANARWRDIDFLNGVWSKSDVHYPAFFGILKWLWAVMMELLVGCFRV